VLQTKHHGEINGISAITIDWDSSADSVRDSIASLPYVRHVKVTRSAASTTYPGENEILTSIIGASLNGAARGGCRLQVATRGSIQ